MALREAVGTETLDLLENLIDELRGVVLLQHQFADAQAMRLHVAAAFPSRHRATKPIGLRGRIAGMDHQFHHLFLEQRDAQRFTEDLLHPFRRIRHRILALPAA